jgi:hypothetical protein
LEFLWRYVDDYLGTATEGRGRRAGRRCSYSPFARWLTLWAALSLPVKWAKACGGRETTWIGFHYVWGSGTMGMTESRAKWIENWAEEVRTKTAVLVSWMRSCLGRLAFSATVIPFILPMLGPFYRFITTYGHRRAAEVPSFLKVLAGWVRDKVVERSQLEMIQTDQWSQKTLWTDAKAADDMVSIGGWLQERPEDGPGDSTWFAVELTPELTPWAFIHTRSGAFRLIAALELFGTLIGIKALLQERGGEGRVRVSALTDNQSNTSLLAKYCTTSMTLGLVLLELGEELYRREVGMDLGWVRRCFNIPADDLTNGEYKDFDMRKRVEVDLLKMHLPILQGLAKEAEQFQEVAKSRRFERKGATARRKRKIALEPW